MEVLAVLTTSCGGFGCHRELVNAPVITNDDLCISTLASQTLFYEEARTSRSDVNRKLLRVSDLIFLAYNTHSPAEMHAVEDNQTQQ